MNPFKTLNIETTTDKKTIKKAYAVLIKQNKPDENPEKFKQIQAAYKQALWFAQSQLEAIDDVENSQVSANEQSNEQSYIAKEPETTEIIEHEQIDVTSSETSAEEAQLLAFQKQQNELIENLYQQLHTMAFAPLKTKARLDNWKFIEDYFKIHDLQRKPEVAATVFKKVAEYNLFQQKQNKSYLIKPEILKYFDSIFDWSSRWNDYKYYFPEHYFTVTFDLFENDYKPPGYIGSFLILFYRGLAFAVDILFFILVPYAIIEVFLPDFTFLTKYTSLFFVVFYLFSELFLKNHTSLGKKYVGLLVLDKFGNIATKDDVLLRHFFMNLINLLPFYLLYSGLLHNEAIFESLFLTIASGNLFCFIVYKQLLHDLASNTFVIKS